MKEIRIGIIGTGVMGADHAAILAGGHPHADALGLTCMGRLHGDAGDKGLPAGLENGNPRGSRDSRKAVSLSVTEKPDENRLAGDAPDGEVI
ncbi:hypothetical protein [Rhizobium sp. BK068]|uniref:hypothetical protein n=1 Tax=Rhizobium sp. BK068 TaxID=2512130 RepID=UPI00104815F0|nr:hypothetical protein [Rhizobium sp. BK068]TCM61937.1 hypothetical protein EV291_15522 [Rhizobium sp. BK068]